MILFIAPKNTGLKEFKSLADKYNNSKSKIVEVRGEDVPLFVSELVKQGKRAIGITGEDLFREFLLKNKDTPIKMLKRINWYNKEYIFGKPTLCLLGPKNKEFKSLPKRLKICINSKYKELAKKYCTNYLENKGYRLEKIYASGSTEELFSNNIVDMIIDVVCTGASAEKAGLEICSKLFPSDIVVLGGKNEKIQP